MRSTLRTASTFARGAHLCSRRFNHGPSKRLDAKTRPTRILVTGSSGQIGAELVPFLRERFGVENVIAGDVKQPELDQDRNEDPFVFCDVTNIDLLRKIVVEKRITRVFHLAAILSSESEVAPERSMQINLRGTENMFKLAVENRLRVYVASSIAAFGPRTPSVNTPDVCIQDPTTIYGIGKVYLELLGQYYNRAHNVDFRCLRYPGMVSYKTLPGGGSTGYGVAMFHSALLGQPYTCPLAADTLLPMMYMDDCIRATADFMSADNGVLTQRVYNVASMSFSPAILAESIRKYIPDFEVVYAPDKRQEIAASWPDSLDDSHARRDWSWKHEFDLENMTKTMLKHLHAHYKLDTVIPGVTDVDGKSC